MNKPCEPQTVSPWSSAEDGHRALRDALGAFATGVTVVSALDPDGRAVGLTVNSFNTVSLDPPLILWSLSLASPNLAAFRAANHFAVNVLAAGQQEIAERFARRSSDKFAGIDWREGLGGAPLLPGCCAVLECRNELQHGGGDHLVFIGRVERFGRGNAEPLLFHGGRYRFLRG
ncbi:MAG: p-hydroxyphenylacetate 3-hydroxylase, reductase component [Rhodocyclaceae bacterium]|nr:flavin reductase family protein [Zoogloeaceae bacterium]MBV6408532.1 p-hydroxyphenylacetate 3-hydroxylase, reductase component [Rhodocyclaceae bacterium]MCK6385936.1 flavin reductase family protein [Rhodocyclaceae bacterium]CAG0932083.1 3-hydroxy-9,10-secoandrosta-1,3,5(10)-triene-9, 17-dione monooxygenase reductase component [Rhodocyclaceae bacterium]